MASRRVLSLVFVAAVCWAHDAEHKVDEAQGPVPDPEQKESGGILGFFEHVIQNDGELKAADKASEAIQQQPGAAPNDPQTSTSTSQESIAGSMDPGFLRTLEEGITTTTSRSSTTTPHNETLSEITSQSQHRGILESLISTFTRDDHAEKV